MIAQFEGQAILQRIRERRMSLRRKLFFAAMTFCVVSTLLVGFAELTVWLVAPQPASWLDIYRRHPRLPLFTLAPNLMREIDTGETHWRIHTDANGLRIPEQATREADDDRPALLVLGDSFAFGHGVNEPLSFIGLLRKRLDGFAVRNASVPAYGLVQYLEVLRDHIAQGQVPKRVLIVSYLGNDIFDCTWNKDIPVRAGVIGDSGDLKSILKRISHLYRLLSRAYHMIAAPKRKQNTRHISMFEPEAWHKAPLSDGMRLCRKAVFDIGTLVREHHISALGVILPMRESIEDELALLPNRKLGAAFESAGITFIDVTQALRTHAADELYFRFNGHFTELGNRLVAKRIADAMPKIGLH
ncbi:MAG: hypothetical protein GY832_35130 [Chloroflexi bacterium]|nr:hypothetical protein [Chloroflexota bacterium]